MTHSTDNEERAIAQYEAARDLEADDPVSDLVATDSQSQVEPLKSAPSDPKRKANT